MNYFVQILFLFLTSQQVTKWKKKKHFSAKAMSFRGFNVRTFISLGRYFMH